MKGGIPVRTVNAAQECGSGIVAARLSGVGGERLTASHVVPGNSSLFKGANTDGVKGIELS